MRSRRDLLFWGVANTEYTRNRNITEKSQNIKKYKSQQNRTTKHDQLQMN